MKRAFGTMRAVVITALLWAASSVLAIDVAGIQIADLSHYPDENLHNEASWSSRSHGIVVIAYTDFKGAEQYGHRAGPYKKAGAQIRSVLRGPSGPGRTFDIYYNGASYVRANNNTYPPADSFAKVLEPFVALQSVDLRMAAKQREIEALERKVKAMDRAFELGADPNINK